MTSKLKENMLTGVRELYPGYFALVMATGIVSIASFMLGMAYLAWTLFLINKAAYVILWLLTLIRLLRYFPDFIDDLIDHVRGPGFFTVVAGTCVLGSQYVIISGDYATAIYLWFTGILLWFIHVYTFFTAMIVHEPKPDLETGIHGGWLISVVAIQSISVLGTLVVSSFPAGQETILFFTLFMYLFGAMLYLLIISLIFYRLIFFRPLPKSFTALYWINMGAAAITTLAGARLIQNTNHWAFLQEILPFLKGFTLFFWATATWWIPLLLILGAWRHVYKRFPLGYDPQYWSIVFPFGMYTTSTLVFAQATGLAPFYLISRYFIYAALVAWVVTFIGMVRSIMNRLVITKKITSF